MRTPEQLLRRNFIIAAVAHLGVLLVVIVAEKWLGPQSRTQSMEVELFTPADILGDMPKGDGYGRGAYTAPAPAPAVAPPAGGAAAETPAAAPAEPVTTTTTAVAPTAVKPTPLQQGEVAVPKTAKPTKPEKPAATGAAAATKPKAGATTAKTAKAGAATGAKTGTGNTAASAANIRNRFARALASVEGGTPYGDNRAPGGGSGRSSVIGSPNGSPDGIAGGVGKGTPFWWYYQQVHDRLYEAWDQPGQALNHDRSLVSIVVLRVARDGRILDARIVSPSGNKIMDASVLEATRGVSKLEPLPAGLGDDSADITVNFELEG